jgi:hypothetical protein
VTGTTLVAVGYWNKERMECKGVFGSGGASVGGMRMRTKICVPCLAYISDRGFRVLLCAWHN